MKEFVLFLFIIFLASPEAVNTITIDYAGGEWKVTSSLPVADDITIKAHCNGYADATCEQDTGKGTVEVNHLSFGPGNKSILNKKSLTTKNQFTCAVKSFRIGSSITLNGNSLMDQDMITVKGTTYKIVIKNFATCLPYTCQ